MSGKISFRKGRHDSRSAYWADQINLSATNIKVRERAIGRSLYSQEITDLKKIAINELGTALGRALSTEEVDRIVSGLETVSGYRPRWTISRQDIIESLTAISKLPPIDALAAMKFVDSSTKALLKEAIRFGCGFREQGVEPPAQLVPQAAGIALAKFTEGSAPGGRPINWYQREIARFAVDTWLALGQTDMSTWHTTDNPATRRGDRPAKAFRSPLVAWTAVFFVSSGEKGSDSQIKIVLDSMPKRGKVNTV